MKTLRVANQSKISIIGQQTIEPNVVYIPIPGLIQEGSACFNPLTEEAIIIENAEKERRSLVQKWFLVPKGFDLKTMAHFIRQKQLALMNQPGIAKRAYTIFTTTACNAACEYCFERGMEPIHMSEEVALQTAHYIEKTHTKRHPVRLRWFGGEPLANRHAVDVICDHLSDHFIPFVSTMSSNGDLFHEVKDDELKRWKLRKVQFTLDDVGGEYDRIKGLPSGAYDRLHDTIDRFTGLGIASEVRIHYHPSKGAEPCWRIIKDLERHKGITAYLRIVYDTEGPDDYAAILKLEDEIIVRGWLKPRFPTYSNGAHCMADNRGSTTIGVYGDLSPCEHYAYGQEMYGSLRTKHFDGKVLAKWAERVKHHEAICSDCSLYASCEIIAACPAEGNCSKGYKDYRIECIRRALRHAANAGEAKLEAVGTAPELICGIC